MNIYSYSTCFAISDYASTKPLLGDSQEFSVMCILATKHVFIYCAVYF